MNALAPDQRTDALRPHAEHAFAAELAALAAHRHSTAPGPLWLSPWAVSTYLLGGTLPDGTVITPKYVGSRRLVEVAVATLATDRALLLLGEPGTAKSMLSELLAAAVCGDSTLPVQGTAGTAEEPFRYGWNYGLLLAKGPIPQALVPSPVLTAMRRGALARVEELTRFPAEVQDALVSILSEPTLPIPELGDEAQASGFNLIATANVRDKGVSELSAALKRRFNSVVRRCPTGTEAEVRIVRARVADLPRPWSCPPCRRCSRRSAGWSPCSAICGPESRGRPHHASSRPRARSPRPRPSRWSRADSPCPRTSGTAGCARRRRGRAPRRDRQRSGGRPRHLDGVPRAGGPRAGRLGGVLRRLPRGA